MCIIRSEIFQSLLRYFALNLNHFDVDLMHNWWLGLGLPAEKRVSGWNGDIPAEGVDDLVLHSENLSFGIGPVRDVDEVSNFWWIDLFIL